MTAEDEAAFERAQNTARRVSDGQLELARDLAELEKSGAWREGNVSFTDHAMNKLRLLPGRSRELLRMQRTLDRLGIDHATACEIGWDKLKVISAKLCVENQETLLKDLKSENIQTIRDKYRPRV